MKMTFAAFEMNGHHVEFKAEKFEYGMRVVVKGMKNAWCILDKHDQDTRWAKAKDIYKAAHGYLGTGSDMRPVLSVINELMGDY